MIPKVIHYCWFGGNPLPELASKCIASWKKHCPDYEIKEWNESNLSLSSIDYMREAYEEKIWGFVPDVARLQIILENGGIYLDTDVEIIKPFDDLLCNHAFMGTEDGKHVSLGLGFGAEKGHPLVRDMLEDYRNRHFRKIDGSLDKTPAPKIQTKLLVKKGYQGMNQLQNIGDAVIYPTEYFCPISYQTNKMKITKNTYSIHHFDASWLTDNEKNLVRKRQAIYRKYGIFARPIWICKRIYLELNEQGAAGMLHFVCNKLKGKIASLIER